MVILALFAFVAVDVASAEVQPQYQIVNRNSKGKAEIVLADLPPLLNQEKAETKDFRIVQGTSYEAVRWSNLDAEDTLRAANALYHLTYAKNYFINERKSEYVSNLPQQIVRLNITNGYNAQFHFDHVDYNPKYNSAYTIPSGVGAEATFADPANPRSQVIGTHPAAWGIELCLNPPKPIPVSEILKQQQTDPLDPTIQQTRSILYPTQITLATQNTSRYLFTSQVSESAFLNSMTRQAGTLAVLEASFLLLKQINRFLLPKYYYNDTAMVPEILYHEYAHAAMSDYMRPFVIAPVVEGMADYFAADIQNSPVIAKHIKQYSTASFKDGSKPKDFDLMYERPEQGTADYVLSLLWNLRRVWGEELTSSIIWKAREKLDASKSNIRVGLMSAIESTCRTECPDPTNDLILMNQYFYGHSQKSKKLH